MAGLTFDIYIRATPEEVWAALTEPELVRQWRFGLWFDSDWKAGSELTSHNPSGTGTVIEAVPRQRLVYEWTSDDDTDGNAGRASRVIFDLTELGTVTGVHVRHDQVVADEELMSTLASGWPRILSSLKSLLETGDALVFGRST